MKTRNRNRIAAFAAAVLGCLSQSASQAQVMNGDLVGSVVDQSGAAVPAASVSALNKGTGIKATANANEAGLYRISNLLSGEYTVTASAAGFAPAALDNVSINANKVATVNLTMQIGQVSTSVEVKEAAVAIDTTTATIQSTFDTQASRDLPVTSIGLGSANLALL